MTIFSKHVRLFVAVALLTTSAMAHASPVEKWECRDASDLSGGWDSILVTATVEAGRKKGKLSVAGVTYEAAYQVAGFDRRWDFGSLPDHSYQYAFIIKPNGDAVYVDFGNDGKAKPSNFMSCHQTGS